MGIGHGTGDNKAEIAAKAAIESPLLETTIEGARSVLINICGDSNLGLLEASEAADLIQSAIDPDAEIIFGTSINESLNDEVIVTVIATGLDPLDKMEISRPAARKEEKPGSIFGGYFGGYSGGKRGPAQAEAETSEPVEKEQNDYDDDIIDIPKFIINKRRP